MTGETRFLSFETAAAWLAGEPDAADRVRQLIDYATSVDQTAELVNALFDALGTALGTRANCERAMARFCLRRRHGVIHHVALVGLTHPQGKETPK